jgi:hypothetical protein
MYQVTPTRRHLIEKHGEAIKDFCPMYFGTGREPDKKPENQGGNTMRIIKRPNIGRGLHRSGWVDAMAAIERVATPAGVLLDDCVEYTFLFGGGNPKPHNEPWVGMFHFPAEFDSPFPQDAANNSAKTLLKNRVFLDSLDSMVGGIALSTPLAAWWQERTGKPFITIKHPTATAVPQWSLEAFQQRPLMLQLGWHLRNTRAIHHQPPIAGWQYARIACYQDYQRKRDQSLQRALGSEPNANVEEWPRLPNDRYDATLASCVAISEAFGMAACNVVVECIARGTPLLTRRCPESVEYLGADYPLYLDDLPMLDSAALLAAHHAMIAARGTWLACSAFASDVAAFCSQFKSNAQNTQQSQYKSNAAEARPQLRNAIAKYLGVSREHASGVVSNWSEERISRTHRAMSEAPIADRVALLAGSVRDQHTPP